MAAKSMKNPDLISREAAIQAVNRYDYRHRFTAEEVTIILRKLPSIEADHVRHGRWIEGGEGIVVCSECGEEHCWEDYRAAYCEDCGAKMDGGIMVEEYKQSDMDPVSGQRR